MWLHRCSKTLSPSRLRLLLLLRRRRVSPLSTAAAVVPDEDPLQLSPPSHYLDGFPRPDPKHDETIVAVARSRSGKSIAAKEKAGRVPSILFEQENGEEGGNKRLISVQTKQIKKPVSHLGQPFLLSRLFDIEVRSGLGDDGQIAEKVRALPRLSSIKYTTEG